MRCAADLHRSFDDDIRADLRRTADMDAALLAQKRAVFGREPELFFRISMILDLNVHAQRHEVFQNDAPARGERGIGIDRAVTADDDARLARKIVRKQAAQRRPMDLRAAADSDSLGMGEILPPFDG